MQGEIECRYCGRDFTAAEMRLMRALIEGPPMRSRSQLAKAFCRSIGWTKPDGGLKEMMARATMLKMHRDGLIELPPPRQGPSPAGPIAFTGASERPLLAGAETLAEASPIRLDCVTGAGRGASRVWNEFVARYHYLGCKRLVGAQLRYIALDAGGAPLAVLGFSAPAWRLAPRDRFIGWTSEARQRNLGMPVGNSRFLILPWARLPNLASHILALARRQLPSDWKQRYNVEPMLIETFVESERFSGGAYRAAGWIHVGAAKGRGRNHSRKEQAEPKKNIWLRPLRKDWSRVLNRVEQQ